MEAVSQSDFFDLLVDTSGLQQQQHQPEVPQPAVAYSNAFKDSDRDTIISDTNMEQPCSAVPSDLADYFLDPHWDLTHENTSSDNSFLEMPAASKAIATDFPQTVFPVPSEELVAVQNSPVPFTIEPLFQSPKIDNPQELSVHEIHPSIKSTKKSGRKSAITSSAERTRHANNEACARYRARRAAGRQSLEAERDALLARNAELRTRLEEKRRALTLLQDSLIKAYIKPTV